MRVLLNIALKECGVRAANGFIVSGQGMFGIQYLTIGLDEQEREPSTRQFMLRGQLPHL